MAEHVEVRSDRFPQLKGQLAREMEAVANEVLDQIAGDIKARQAHDFDVQVESKGKDSAIYIGGDPSFHAGFTEYGTINQPARPFVTPAAEQSRDKLNHEMANLGGRIT